MTQPAGVLDIAALVRWLSELGVRDCENVSVRLLSGGRSNLTYRLDLPGGRRWVLRRPPAGHTLDSAHDVLREFRVLDALSSTTVPVPAVHGSDDGDVLGVPFYVMDFVDGVVPVDEALVASWPTQARHRCGTDMIDALADLHAIDPNTIGLADLGRPSGYLQRQLRRWNQQWYDSTERDLPIIREVHDRLAAACPPDAPASLVHGDFHIGNCVLSTAGELLAVLDWEMCTQGDAIADLATMLMYWGRDGRHPALPASPTALDGFAEHEELRARYEQRRGVQLPDLEWYLAFANWRLACIVEGVLARVNHGAMGSAEQFDLDWLRRTPADRAEVALELLT